MKRIVIIATLLILGCLHSYSQDKNLFLIGGNIGGMFSSNNISDLNIIRNQYSTGGFSPQNLIGTYGDNPGDYKTIYLEFNPNILYYLTDKLLVGIGCAFLNERNKYESNLITKSITKSYLISPTVRYFIYQGLFCQFEYNIGKSFEDIYSNNLPIAGSTGFSIYDYSTDISGSVSGINVSAGYSIPLGNNVTTEIAFNYLRNKNKFKYDNSSETGTYNIKQNIGLISIGFKYILKAKT